MQATDTSQRANASTPAPESTFDQPSAASSRDFAAAWRTALPVTLLALLGLIGLYWDTAASMVAIWHRSETFAHGFLILPISLWLIWRKRHALAAVRPTRSYFAVLLLLGAVFAWLVARLTGILVGEQLALTAMLPLLVWALLGWPVVRTILFPLAFLFFAVPMGEGLIPPMMDFTAAFTVRMLQLTGIPVYWEGLFFTIPSGQWSVVEGCSGVRYLIASVTLGTLYAYLTYRSYWRRGIFILASIIVPIFANGMRAYMIVMIAHLSDMQLALGVDHFIYGWVWFGIVMMILFWVGSFWRQDEEDSAHPEKSAASTPNERGSPVPAHASRRLPVLLATILVAAMGPVWASYSTGQAALTGGVALVAPVPAGGWLQRDEAFTDWQPNYVSPTAALHTGFSAGERKVGLFLAFYAGHDGDAELVNSQNVMVVQKHPVWRMPFQRSHRIEVGGRSLSVLESELSSVHGERLVVWHWYWIAGRHITNPYLAKLQEAVALLTGEGRDGVGVVVYTQQSASLEAARADLEAFLGEMLPSLEARLQQVTDSEPSGT